MTRCKVCETEKDDALFKWQGGRRAGLVCRACDLEKKRSEYAKGGEYRERAISRARGADPEKGKQRAREWRERNAERLRKSKAAYHVKNAEKINARSRTWYAENKERVAERSAHLYSKYKRCYSEKARHAYLKNKDRMLARNSEWRKANRGLMRAYFRAYELAKINRTPPWSETAAIREFYKNRPDGHHVDHIVPLMGKNVCGLHVLANLQYLPAVENLSKGNRFTCEA